MSFILLSVLTFFTSVSHAADLVGGVPLLEPVVRESTVMGKPLRVEQDSATVASGLGVVSTTHAQFVGHSLTLMEASVEAIPSAPADTTATTAAVAAIATPSPGAVVLGNTDLYVDGVKLWTGALSYQNGTLSYSGGIAPVQIPFTIFVYPVGPLTLEVDAGVDFEGELDATLAPGLSYPFTDSTLDAQLTASVGAGGFIEGYANLWLLRAGVGGAVDLVDGSIGLSGHIYLDGQTPTGAGFGLIHLLSGDIYAFADDRFFFGNWNRFWQHDFYKWSGWCYSFGATTCGIQ